MILYRTETQSGIVRWFASSDEANQFCEERDSDNVITEHLVITTADILRELNCEGARHER